MITVIELYCKGRPEGSGVVVNGLLVPDVVFQEVGVVVVDFGIVWQSLDTRAETGNKNRKIRCRSLVSFLFKITSLSYL